MIFDRLRVEEDLERIRKSNLPPDQLATEEAKEALGKENRRHLERGDIFAMILAAFSIIIPYALAIMGAMGLVLLLFKLLFT